MEGTGSGATEAKAELETIPNLAEFKRMSLNLTKDAALIASIKSSAQNREMIVNNISCPGDLSSPSENAADPDKLGVAQSQIYLFDNSSIVASLSIAKGDNTTDPKLYMITCNSGSKAKVSNYENSDAMKTSSVVSLKLGQSVFESVALRKQPSVGILTSFECNDDDQILRGLTKKQGELATNRIRMRKGSALMVYRAIEQKVRDKKLNELGNEKQNKLIYTVISCQG